MEQETPAERVYVNLQEAGFGVRKLTAKPVIKVHDPQDTAKLYEIVQETADSAEIRMTYKTVFDVIVDD